jgi:hypothetical protein
MNLCTHVFTFPEKGLFHKPLSTYVCLAPSPTIHLDPSPTTVDPRFLKSGFRSADRTTGRMSQLRAILSPEARSKKQAHSKERV